MLNCWGVTPCILDGSSWERLLLQLSEPHVQGFGRDLEVLELALDALRERGKLFSEFAHLCGKGVTDGSERVLSFFKLLDSYLKVNGREH